jgi:hypothetical protein
LYIGQQPNPAAQLLANIQGEIDAVGARQDLPYGDAGEKLLVGHPATPLDDLAMHPARQAATKAAQPHLGEHAQQHRQRRRGRGWTIRHSGDFLPHACSLR